MKKSIVIAGIVATLASSAMAQKLELRDLTSYRYMPKQIHGITPSPVNPKTYTIIKAEKESIRNDNSSPSVLFKTIHNN